MPRRTAGSFDGRISVRNSSTVGATNSLIGLGRSVGDEFISIALAAAGIDALRSERLDVRFQPRVELFLVARALRPPCDFRQRKQAREGHELHVTLGGDELG